MVGLSLTQWRKVFFALMLSFGESTAAYASSAGNLPFNSTMDMLQQSISGPFLLAAAIIMIVVTCLMLAFGEWGDGFKKMINIVLWLSVAFAAPIFITTMFGGGAVC